MIEVNHLLLYIFGALPFLGIMAFGYFIVWQDRKREKEEELNKSEHK